MSAAHGGPLSGRRVVVTRARAQADVLVDRLQDVGAEVVLTPVIEIADPPTWTELDAALEILAGASYEWVIFTSVNSVERVWERMKHLGLPGSVYEPVKTAAVGTTTAELLRDKGVAPTLVPPRFSAASLAEALGAGSGRVLLPRASGAPEGLPSALRTNGWTVDEVTAYETRLPERVPEAAAQVRAGKFDVLTFTSGSCARNFVRLIATPPAVGCSLGAPLDKILACIGPETARVAHDLGFRVDVVPDQATVSGLVEALVDQFDGTIAR